MFHLNVQARRRRRRALLLCLPPAPLPARASVKVSLGTIIVGAAERGNEGSAPLLFFDASVFISTTGHEYDAVSNSPPTKLISPAVGGLDIRVFGGADALVPDDKQSLSHFVHSI